VLTHGANPGMVSHLVKDALLTIAAKQGLDLAAEAAPLGFPASREDWARLAQRLGLRAIHISERDTQVQNAPKRHGQFVNTWSVDGFIAEGCQPAELGWGTHEKGLPHKGERHTHGCDAAIYVNRPGAATKVRTWAPLEGPFHGFLITHNEAISLADYFTLGGGAPGVAAAYRPTVHYSYHPCDDAIASLHEFAGKNWTAQTERLILCDEIVDGRDELGVLLMGTAPATGEHFALWHGSQLDIHTARQRAPHNSATTLQVSSSVLAATLWAMRNPRRGIVEPEDLPHRDILGIVAPYIAPMVSTFTDWTPLQNRGLLFAEDVDEADPWQFKNILVA
jgi:homospermidine synthase